MAANPSVISTASFRSDTYYFDPLLAGECLSQSAQLSSGQGILKRGQILCGWAVGTARNVALSTAGTAPTICAILAVDTDTGAGGPVTTVIYTQGKFLVTALTASANGLEVDSASLWNVGIYVMTVEQRSGKLVPWSALPATPGLPLPQNSTIEEARKANKDQVDAIRAAIDAKIPPLGEEPPALGRSQDPAWAQAAFGERDPTKEETAQEKIAAAAADLHGRQHKAVDELSARHAKELADLHRKLHDERGQHAKQADDSIKQARQGNGGTAPPNPPKK